MVKRDTLSGTDSAPGTGLVVTFFSKSAFRVCRAVRRQVVCCKHTKRTVVLLRVALCALLLCGGVSLFEKGVR